MQQRIHPSYMLIGATYAFKNVLFTQDIFWQIAFSPFTERKAMSLQEFVVPMLYWSHEQAASMTHFFFFQVSHQA